MCTCSFSTSSQQGPVFLFSTIFFFKPLSTALQPHGAPSHSSTLKSKPRVLCFVTMYLPHQIPSSQLGFSGCITVCVKCSGISQELFSPVHRPNAAGAGTGSGNSGDNFSPCDIWTSDYLTANMTWIAGDGLTDDGQLIWKMLHFSTGSGAKDGTG